MEFWKIGSDEAKKDAKERVSVPRGFRARNDASAQKKIAEIVEALKRDGEDLSDENLESLKKEYEWQYDNVIRSRIVDHTIEYDTPSALPPLGTTYTREDLIQESTDPRTKDEYMIGYGNYDDHWSAGAGYDDGYFAGVTRGIEELNKEREKVTELEAQLEAAKQEIESLRAKAEQTISPKDVKIWLCPSYDAAIKQKDTLEADGHVVACSEAEYGDLEVKGSRDDLSLAHHGPREANPAPCLAKNRDPHDAPDAFLVSHIDLDAVGGILALQGIKPEDDKFWEAAAFIDVNGGHHLKELQQNIQDKLNAVYAWNDTQKTTNTNELKEPIDVTAEIREWQKALDAIIDERHPEHEAMIEAGRKMVRDAYMAVENKLVFENENVRVFVSDGPNCNQNYVSSKTGEHVPAIISRNKYGGITLSFEDGGQTFSAREIMQSIFGKEAGGRDGIAGSPRGQKVELSDLSKVACAVNSKYIEKQPVQQTTLDDAKIVDTSEMNLQIKTRGPISPTDDLEWMAEQLEKKYRINNGRIGCEPTVEGIKMYTKAVQKISSGMAIENPDSIHQDTQAVLEGVTKSEERTRIIEYAKEISSKVYEEPFIQIATFKNCVVFNIQDSLEKKGLSDECWIISSAREALDKATINAFNIEEAATACDGIEIKTASGTKKEATKFLQEAITKATEEMELDRDEQTHDDDTGLH